MHPSISTISLGAYIDDQDGAVYYPYSKLVSVEEEYKLPYFRLQPTTGQFYFQKQGQPESYWFRTDLKQMDWNMSFSIILRIICLKNINLFLLTLPQLHSFVHLFQSKSSGCSNHTINLWVLKCEKWSGTAAPYLLWYLSLSSDTTEILHQWRVMCWIIERMRMIVSAWQFLWFM